MMKSRFSALATTHADRRRAWHRSPGAAPISKAHPVADPQPLGHVRDRDPRARQGATEVLCAARGIPAPKHGGSGDPGCVQLGLLGKPQVLRLSQDSFVAGKTPSLGHGRLWNQLRVTCHVASSPVMCFDGQRRVGDRQRALPVVLTAAPATGTGRVPPGARLRADVCGADVGRAGRLPGGLVRGCSPRPRRSSTSP